MCCMFYLMFNYLQHSFAQSRLMLCSALGQILMLIQYQVDQVHIAELDLSRLLHVAGSFTLDVDKP